MTDDIDFIIMGCDGIWEKKSNEEMVEYVYAKLKMANEEAGGDYAKIDLKKIVAELLHDSLADDVKEAQGVGCDNMTCILIVFNTDFLKN